MLLPHLARARRRRVVHRRHHDGAVRGQRAAEVRLRRGDHRSRRRARRQVHRRGVRGHPAQLARRTDPEGAAGRQGGVRGEAAGAHRGRAGRRARGGGGVRQRPAAGGLQPPVRAAAAGGQAAVRRPDRPGEPALPGQRGPAASTAAGTSSRAPRARASPARAGTSSTRRAGCSRPTRSRCTRSPRPATRTCRSCCATRTGPPPPSATSPPARPASPRRRWTCVADGKVLRLDDFVRASVYDGRRKRWVSSRLPKARDKGQSAELAAFIKAVRTGGPMPVPLESLVATTRGHPRRAGRPGRRRAGDAGEGAMTVSSGSPGWYLRRLSRMGPREVGGRVGDAVRRRRWRSAPPDCPSVTGARFTAVLPAGTIAAVPPDAAKRLIAEADRLMAGHAEYFGVVRDDLVDPDWWYDPKTGRRAPSGLRLRRAVPRRGRGRGHQADLGAVPASVPHRARRRLRDHRGRAVRRAGGRAPAVVVGGQPTAARRALDQRHRAGHPAAVLGVDPPAARRLAGRGRAVRGQPGGA